MLTVEEYTRQLYEEPDREFSPVFIAVSDLVEVILENTAMVGFEHLSGYTKDDVELQLKIRLAEEIFHTINGVMHKVSPD